MRQLSQQEMGSVSGGTDSTRVLEAVVVFGSRWDGGGGGGSYSYFGSAMHWGGGSEYDYGGGMFSIEPEFVESSNFLQNVQSGRTDYDNCVTQQQGALDAANAHVQYWSDALEYYMTETIPDGHRVPGSGDIQEAGLVFLSLNNYNAALATLNEVQERIHSCSGPGDA